MGNQENFFKFKKLLGSRGKRRNDENEAKRKRKCENMKKIISKTK